LVLYGRLTKSTHTIREAMVEKKNDAASYTDLLEECLIELCRQLDIQVPLWLEKNTNEFVRYRRTFFNQEHFLEKVYFDRFEIKTE
jgi:hypothetical protein